MHFKRFFSTIFFFIFLLQGIHSQECQNYFKSYCNFSPDKLYKVHESSRNQLVSNGETVKFLLSVVNGYDYRIALCYDSVFDQVISLKLLNGEGNILYDNSTDKFSFIFEFSAIQTQDIEVQVAVPQGKPGLNANPDCQGCLGILIQFMITPKIGF